MNLNIFARLGKLFGSKDIDFENVDNLDEEVLSRAEELMSENEKLKTKIVDLQKDSQANVANLEKQIAELKASNEKLQVERDKFANMDAALPAKHPDDVDDGAKAWSPTWSWEKDFVEGKL